jgi:hypothetical protein
MGRFLSADPVIQDPNNLQCYNRYSYCTNNPLIRIDPSGYTYFPSVILDPLQMQVAAGQPGLDMVMKTQQTVADKTGELLANPIVQGVGKILGATGEGTAAGLLAATPEPTMMTKAAAVGLGAHALDLFQAGARQVTTGEEKQTLSSELATNLAEATGASPEVAQTIGQLSDAAAAGASLSALGLGPIQSTAGSALPKTLSRSASAVNSGNTSGQLTAASRLAVDLIGPGRGPVYGTRVHSAFQRVVQALGRTDLSTEVSYLNGQVVPRGTPGSVRLDVVEGPLTSPIKIFDLKTGSATLTPQRITQIQQNIPGGTNVLVDPIHP